MPEAAMVPIQVVYMTSRNPSNVVLYGCTAVWYCMGNILESGSSRILLDLVGILMPSAECMGLYRGGPLSNRSELDAMGGMPLGV